jgi:hypothetical protein
MLPSIRGTCFIGLMTTLDGILTAAETLPMEEQRMLEELLRGRRIENWRGETAAEARKAERAFRAGKVKPLPIDGILAQLHADA